MKNIFKYLTLLSVIFTFGCGKYKELKNYPSYDHYTSPSWVGNSYHLAASVEDVKGEKITIPLKNYKIYAVKERKAKFPDSKTYNSLIEEVTHEFTNILSQQCFDAMEKRIWKMATRQPR